MIITYVWFFNCYPSPALASLNLTEGETLNQKAKTTSLQVSDTQAWHHAWLKCLTPGGGVFAMSNNYL